MEPAQIPEQPAGEEPVDDERIPAVFVRWAPVLVPFAAAVMALGMFVIYFEILT